MASPEGTPEQREQARELGQRLRALRRMRGMTLVQLAEKAELSHSFLSQIERGRAMPSIGSLGRIAHAVGTSQIELLTPPSAPTRSNVVPTAAAPRGTYGDEAARLLVTHAGARFRPLSLTGFSQEFGEPYSHAEHEFLHVISGRVEVEIDGEVSVLDEGDSVYYGSDVPHRWRAADDQGFHAIVVKEQPAASRTAPSAQEAP
ncbi:helix-turn-helix domain-containing protein [Demequina aestuarii]|uniref:helix-turn-helix domain-containing protein n=1 Tax=Demequina aestuarii TaxID=327095 RepID=UPI000785E9B3|nr:helix-turn-helix domain-containing protein [Demequina aestuarii]